MSRSAGDVLTAKTCAAITAAKPAIPSQMLVRRISGVLYSPDAVVVRRDCALGFNDVLEGKERGDEENEVVGGEQPDPGARLVHQVCAQQGL